MTDEADDETCTGCWGTGWNANMEEICDCQPKPPIPMSTEWIHPTYPDTPEYTEGVCHDGAAILRDGCMMTISDVLSTLNGYAAEVARLRRSIDAARYADWLQHGQ